MLSTKVAAANMNLPEELRYRKKVTSRLLSCIRMSELM